MQTRLKTIIATLILCIGLIPTTVAQLHLPKLIGNGMVLQRDAEVNIWGWDNANEKVVVQFLDKTYETTTDTSGKWQIVMHQLKAGGPFKMVIKGSSTVTISDILIGDVWLCSGQSNMELPMRRVLPLYGKEIENCQNNNIRYFAVPQKYNFNKEQEDLSSGAWQTTNPANVLNFSAVSYFFAKAIYNQYQVPIGLINASLGGSPAESWISEQAIHQFPAYDKELQLFKSLDFIKQIEDADNARIDAWYKELAIKDKGHQNGVNWSQPDMDISGWPVMNIPGYWADETKLGAINGTIWFRKDVTLPATMAGQVAQLNLGRIVDADSVFVNGTFVGNITYQYPPRWYTVPANVLKEGKNTIVIKVISNIDKGGFIPDKKYELKTNKETVDLTGTWHYQVGATMEPLESQTFVRWKPVGLYNAMIAPLASYRIKGAIWYQGEANTKNPEEYKILLPTLIKNWRETWHQGEFPFLFAQLPNFMEAKPQPSESNWAMLRESQRQTLSVPNTCMTVNIDLGEWNDIHPLNKKDVADRLAKCAEKLAYGDTTVVCSGPMLKHQEIKGSKIVLTFDQVGSGLMAKGSRQLKEFAIAGSDKQFVWAKASIKGNQVIVWNKKVKQPVVVRYAWADNPQNANLFNKEGLPASPFRTDD